MDFVFSIDQFTAISGGLAASIAVGAFIGQVVPGITRAPEEKVRQHAVVGGLAGLLIAVIVIVLSALAW